MPAININLLPQELSAKSGVASLSKVLKKASIVGLGAFSLIGMIVAGIFIYFSFEIGNANKINDTLKSKITTLEVAEQKTILVKDRLQKVRTIMSGKDVLPLIENIRTLIALMPSGASISDTDIDANGKVKISFKVADPSSLTVLFANIAASTNYKQMVIKNFSFNQATGYLVALEGVSK